MASTDRKAHHHGASCGGAKASGTASAPEPVCGMKVDPAAIEHHATQADQDYHFCSAGCRAKFVASPKQYLSQVTASSNWIQFVLATPVVLWAGWPFFTCGWASLKSRHLNMFTLIALGVGVAYLYSLVAHFAPPLFPPAFHDAMGTVPVYFEAAAVITVLVLFGQVLELRPTLRREAS